jgi:hypothetical protein
MRGSARRWTSLDYVDDLVHFTPVRGLTGQRYGLELVRTPKCPPPTPTSRAAPHQPVADACCLAASPGGRAKEGEAMRPGVPWLLVGMLAGLVLATSGGACAGPLSPEVRIQATEVELLPDDFAVDRDLRTLSVPGPLHPARCGRGRAAGAACARVLVLLPEREVLLPVCLGVPRRLDVGGPPRGLLVGDRCVLGTACMPRRASASGEPRR